MSDHIIEVAGLSAYYGKACALESISYAFPKGRVTGVLGRNGAGKTTLLTVLMGLLPVASGSYRFDGRDASRMAPHHLARAGLAFVPADRQVFGTLTVDENLSLARLSKRSGRWDLAQVFQLFPRLQERRRNLAENLSGGEKQMLSIARALMTNPMTVLLDEPTEGLAPLLVEEVVRSIAYIREQGVSVVVVEQNFKAIAPVLDTVLVLDSGRVGWQGLPADLSQNPQVMVDLLGV